MKEFKYVITDKEGIHPNSAVYKVLDVIVNILRSIPFLILLILVIPLTRLLVGKTYGSTATIVPLVIAAAPFIARMVESSLKESTSSRIQNFPSGRCDDRSGNDPGIFCNGRNCRWRRTG